MDIIGWNTKSWSTSNYYYQSRVKPQDIIDPILALYTSLKCISYVVCVASDVLLACLDSIKQDEHMVGIRESK